MNIICFFLNYPQLVLGSSIFINKDFNWPKISIFFPLKWLLENLVDHFTLARVVLKTGYRKQACRFFVLWERIYAAVLLLRLRERKRTVGREIQREFLSSSNFVWISFIHYTFGASQIIDLTINCIDLCHFIFVKLKDVD